MGCGKVRELLPLCAGGELEDGERLAVEAHLEFCLDCARELDRYREVRSWLAGLREDEPPAGTWRRIWAEVRKDLPSAPARAGGRPAGALAVRLAASLVIGFLIGLGVHVARRSARPVLPSGAAPTVGTREGAIPAAVPAGSRAPARTSPGGLGRDGPESGRVSPTPARDRFHLPWVESFPPPDEKDF